MFKFLSWCSSLVMTGTVDKVHGGNVIAELSSVSKTHYHLHLVEFPVWMFPCSVKEGTKFWIEVKKKSTTIRCGEK